MKKTKRGAVVKPTYGVKPAYRDLPLETYKEFYKLLINHNYAEAASQVGMDTHYQGSSLRAAGYHIYKDIQLMGVSKLDISEDIVEVVEKAIENRKVFKGNKIIKDNKAELEFPKAELLDPSDTKQMVVGGRNKAAMLLHKKFDMINGSKSALKNTSLSQLGTVFGILFDKAQIIQGQATENISVLSKNINDDMTAKDSLDAILRMREEEVVKKAEG